MLEAPPQNRPNATPEVSTEKAGGYCTRAAKAATTYAPGSLRDARRAFAFPYY